MRQTMSLSNPSMPRRLAINGRFLSQSITGVQRYAREMVVGLDRLLVGSPLPRGMDAVLLLPPDVDPAAELLNGSLRRIKPIRVGSHTGQMWEQYDLLSSAGGDLLVNLCNSAPLLHRRQIVCIHDAAVKAQPKNYSLAFRIWYHLLHGTLTRSARRIFTVSEFSADEIARCYGADRREIAVVPNAAEHMAAVVPDPQVLRQHGLTPGEYVFALGGNSRTKNVAAVVRALHRMGEPRPKLVVAGHATTRIFSGKGDAEELGISVGKLSDGELKALYQNALCFVFPSLYEGFGIPPLEAMTCGCPVIVSPLASLPEVCGTAALYADPFNPSDIAEKIVQLRDEPSLSLQMRSEGYQRAKSFSWANSAHRLLGVISQELSIAPAAETLPAGVGRTAST
jgi:glycosyltransferase involved in cell wall biosynthesis